MSLSYKVQYFVLPPLHLITSDSQWGTDSTNCRLVSDEMEAQVALQSSTVHPHFWCMLFLSQCWLRISHRFSIGLRSGLCGGHLRTLIFCSLQSVWGCYPAGNSPSYDPAAAACLVSSSSSRFRHTGLFHDAFYSVDLSSACRGYASPDHNLPPLCFTVPLKYLGCRTFPLLLHM